MIGKLITGITILLLTIIVTTSPALAASAGVSPANIILNGTQGETYTINFAAVNTGNDTTNYSIYARGNITNWAHLNITEVNLAGKEAFVMKALITIPTNLPDGTYKGDIIIKSIPDSAGGGNKVSVAVNLPVTITIKNTKSIVMQQLYIPMIIILIILLCVVVFLIKKRTIEQPKDISGDLV